jgi:hypothetical protein
MTLMAPTRNRRWLRFSLRGLLVLLTVAAIGSWVYWDGWARWELRRQQQDFVAQAMDLRRGGLISHDWRPQLTRYGPPFVSEKGGQDAKGRYKRYLASRWPSALYVVFWQYKDSRCTSVEVFCLPPAPKDYKPRTLRSRLAVKQQAAYLATAGRWQREVPPPDMSVDAPNQLAYKLDFVEMISGDRLDRQGFGYELIHVDPTRGDGE